jgi:hypothetical protein
VPREHKRLKGFAATYYKYLYLLGKVGKRKAPARVSTVLRADIAKLDRYRRQFRFLYDNRIGSATELSWYTDALKNEIDILVQRRKPLYKERQQAYGVGREELSEQIDSINAALRPLRRQLRLCEQIGRDAEEIRRRADAAQAALERPVERVKTKDRDKAPRNIM